MKTITKDNTQKAHAKFGASSSERWLACPGSISLSMKAPPGRDSPYAIEGTRGHECLEIFLNNRKNFKSTRAMLIKKYGMEMTEHAADAALEIWKRAPSDATLLAETRADLSFVAPDMFGTADAVIVELFGRLTVIDYKYGAGIPVDPESNSQLIYYALGIAHQYDYNFSEVALVIIQPRAEHPGGPVREWVTTIEHLLEWRAKFELGVKLATATDAPTVTGDWCRFCPAAVICPELSRNALKSAKADFDDSTGTLTLPDVIAPDQLGRTLQAMELLETWIEKTRALAFDVLNKGVNVPGYKLVEKRSIRRWIDAEKTTVEARQEFGPAAFKVELLSPAQLEKIPNAKEWIAERVTAVSSGTTMVAESDKRPAINQITLDFGEPETRKEVEPIKQKPTKPKSNRHYSKWRKFK